MKNRNYIFDCEIVHRIHGRIRIKSKSLKYLGIYKKEVEVLKELIQKSVIENVLRERGETDPDIEKINSYEQQLHRKHLRLMLPVYILMILIFYGYHLYVYITK